MSEDFFRKICTSHFIVRFRKGLLRVLLWEGVGDRTKTAIYWPHSYGHQRCVLLVLLMLNRRPRGLALCWMMAFFTASYHQLVSKAPAGVSRAPWPGVAFPTTSCLRRLWSPTHQGPQGPPLPGFLYHILSATSLDPNSIGGPESPFGLVWLSLPHRVSNSVRSLSVWLPVLIELYNSSTPTQSPTQSLEWYVWLSSSRNNCHAVHSASVYESTMGILPCPILLPKSTYGISPHKCHQNVSLPSGASLWNGIFGRVESQHTTLIINK